MNKLTARSKAAIIISAFIVMVFTAFCLWYVNPGYDPIETGPVVEFGKYHLDGYAGEWKICKSDQLHDLPKVLAEYSYTCEPSLSLDAIYAEKSWLCDSRFRRITILSPKTITDAKSVTENIARLGSSTVIKSGDCYAFMWSGYCLDLGIVIDKLSYIFYQPERFFR